MKTLQQPQCSMCGCTGQGCNQQGADLGGAPLQLQCAAAFEEDCNQAALGGQEGGAWMNTFSLLKSYYYSICLVQ